MGRVQQGYKGNRCFICRDLRDVHFGNREAPAAPLLMYRRNLEGARSSARVSLPNDKEARHFCSHRTQPAQVSSAVDVGVRGSRAAHQEERDFGFADFALLSFERGRRFVPDRPTSFPFLPRPSNFAAVSLPQPSFVPSVDRHELKDHLRGWGDDGTAIQESFGTSPATKTGQAPSVIFSASAGALHDSGLCLIFLSRKPRNARPG